MALSVSRQSAVAELKDLLGDRLCTDGQVLEEHRKDASHHTANPPDAVAYPETDEEVSRILRVCGHHSLPVIPFGTGTGVEGGILAVRGGLCLDLRHMDRILEVNAGDLDARVQAAVTRKQLNQHLAETAAGLHFPVGPGTDASLGGMAATRASGTEAVAYGTMRENVLGLTAVMPDGRIIRTGGRFRKSSAGYDLTRLLVGSEGTLGVITEVALRLARIPEAISAAACPFPHIEAALHTVTEIVSSGIPVAKCELLDDTFMEAVRRYSGLDYAVTPTLFLEFHGGEEAVAEQARSVGKIAAAHEGRDFQWATEEADRQRLWQARFDAHYACLALRPGCVGYVTDICVPLSRLAECVQLAKLELETTDLIAPLFGHVGDGNFHVVILVDPEKPDELVEAKRLAGLMIDHALDLGGTCTGEHGVGLGKTGALEREAGEALSVMRAIKNALDPHGIMNPGKVLRLE